MKKLTIGDVLRECGGTLLYGSDSMVLEAFSKDTRTISDGCVYLGIRGDNYDGNGFYLDALEKGAKCCILDKFDETTFDQEKWADVTIIVVDDTLKCVQKLATYKRSLVDIPVIAVTGSVGKTCTKDMIASVLSEKYDVLKSEGNLNGQLGLPLNILKLQDESVMVLEMGMNGFGMISTLTNIAKPSIGVFTNIGTAHIGILGSRKNILKAKLEMLEGMKENSTLIINNDTGLLRNLSLPNYHFVRCGINNQSEFMASNILIHENLTKYLLTYQNETIEIEISAMGEAFVRDSLLAAAVGIELGLTMDEIKSGLAKFKLAGNRMSIIPLKDNITIIDDTYNSNYEALVSAIDSLVLFPGKRKIAVLGDVLEMDDYAYEIHQKIGCIPSLLKVDALFLNGVSAKYIKEGAIHCGFPPEKLFYFEKKDDLEKSLLQFLKPEDTVLIKASKAMLFPVIVDKIKESYKL